MTEDKFTLWNLARDAGKEAVQYVRDFLSFCPMDPTDREVFSRDPTLWTLQKNLTKVSLTLALVQVLFSTKEALFVDEAQHGAPLACGTAVLLLPTLLLGLWLLFQGLHHMAKGWRGWLRTTHLAATLVSLIARIPEMTQGFREAWNEGANKLRIDQVPASMDRFGDGNNALLILLFFILTPTFYKLGRRREEARRLAERMKVLQDQALRAKLAPHFIFNTLNTLRIQIRRDPTAAEATTERLAQLFRQVVEVAERTTIPLREELLFVEAYLGIEQDRLGSRLSIEVDVPEELEDREVPPLALQVLVENAIKHGIAPQEAGGTLRIEARPLGDRALTLAVEDTGLGLGAEPGTGTALATLRQRLARPEDLQLMGIPGGFRASFTWRHP